MAVDVLMSGLSHNGPGADPLHGARLHLTIAQIEAERNNWSKVHTHGSSGMTLVAPAVPAAPAADLALQGGGLATRALLIMGHDNEALALAAQCEQALRPVGHAATAQEPQQAPSSSPAALASSAAPHVRSLGLLALAAHAAAAGPLATSGGPTRGSPETSESPASTSLPSAATALKWLAAELGREGPELVRRDPSLADAATGLGLLRLAARDHEAAADSVLEAAAEAAAAARAAGAGAAGTASWPPHQHHAEVEADALTGRAQLQMRRHEWGAAEELLGSALKAAEAANGERSASLAPLLTLLGYTYSRSARVTFAEGLFREAAKLMRLDPGRFHRAPSSAHQPSQQQGQGQGQEQEPGQQQQERSQEGQGQDEQRQQQEEREQQLQLVRSSSAAVGVHASTGAVLAWRYAQLLWVLPNRGGEAERWEGCARQLWAGCGALAGHDIEAVLGGRAHLKGQGPEGSGVMVSTRFRRAWPCVPPRH